MDLVTESSRFAWPAANLPLKQKKLRYSSIITFGVLEAWKNRGRKIGERRNVSRYGTQLGKEYVLSVPVFSQSSQGWTDAMRKLRPTGPLWTFWDYKFERWEKDKGMRLDHFLLPPKMSDRLVDGSVDRWVRGEVNASDHPPVWIMLDL